jgi:predicted metal-dependent phosphoesterase TrpH
MQPPLIIAEAVQQGIQILAITDHNASANIPAVIQAAQGSSITVFPGMEVQTLEEVHCLCLFDTLEQIQAWQKLWISHCQRLRTNQIISATN